MLFFTAITALAAAASTALAEIDNRKFHSRRNCLPRPKVDTIIQNYQTVVGNIASVTDDEVRDMLHSDFVDWSNSISAFFGAPYTAPVFPDRETFITRQRAARAQVPIEIESVAAYTCDTVVIIWNGFPMPNQIKSRGITVIEVDKEDGLWKISRVDVEFNSLAWAASVGGAYQVFNQQVGNFTCDDQ